MIREACTDPHWTKALKNLSKKETQDIMTIAGTITPVAPLDREEEVRLITLAQAGESSATETLVRSQVRSIVRMASRRASNIDPADLFQAGVAALMEAISLYDPASGVRLWSYARAEIEGAMIRELDMMSGPVCLPNGSIYNGEYLDRPGVRQSVQDALADPVSWADYIGEEEGGMTLADVTPDLSDGVLGAEYEDREKVAELLNKLTNPSHIYILKASFGFFGEMTDEEIAERIGVKRTAVVMARKRALDKLRKLAES